ncbi:MAG: CpsB/CapC family capsule biosynthesis tyrosine phosphatase [Thermodesulfobacteriota bacterium]
MIDLHCHILPGLDDGPQTWEESLEMASQAVKDGIRVLVATPHLFRHRRVNLQELNEKEAIFQKISEFREKLAAAQIPLEILPGCDFPLSFETLELLEQDRVITINDARRYLLLELPDTSLPPATEEICFSLRSKGITPIITHPERHWVFQERPEKLGRLLDLGCLAQLTAGSLTGFFGRQVAKLSRTLVKKGLIHVVATDAHSTQGRLPVLSEAVAQLSRLIGKDAAAAMVTTIPEKIIHGEALAEG